MLGEKVSIVRAQSLLLIVLIDKSLDENDLKMSKWFERAKKRWTKYKQRVVKSLDTNYKQQRQTTWRQRIPQTHRSLTTREIHHLGSQPVFHSQHGTF